MKIKKRGLRKRKMRKGWMPRIILKKHQTRVNRFVVAVRQYLYLFRIIRRKKPLAYISQKRYNELYE